jgi:hypothetical protein
MFFIVSGASVVLYRKGVYQREGHDDIYVGWGSGYIRIAAEGGTSNPDVRYEDLTLPFTPAKGSFNRPKIPATYFNRRSG